MRCLQMSLLAIGFLCSDPADSLVHENQSAEPGVDPEATVVEFLLGMLERDEKRILGVILPDPEEAILFQVKGERPPPQTIEKKQKHIRTLKLRRLKIGDVVRLPGGETLVMNKTHINENRLQITSQENPIPFIVVKFKGVWKIDASPIIAGRKTAAKLEIDQGGQIKETPAWTADEKVEKSLGEEVRFDGFKLRPPKEYREIRLAKGLGVMWQGTPRADGTKPYLLLIQAPSDSSRYSLERHLHSVITSAIERRREALKRTATQRNKINGLTFVRATWKGMQSEATMHGQIYVTFDEKRAIALLTEDAAPHHEVTLKITEASILSFRKQAD